MIDLNKSREFFNPDKLHIKVSIVGCGAVGSQLAVLLARLGIKDFILYDEDVVNSHNIANQNFNFNDIGKFKVDCVKSTIKAINPDAEVETRGFASVSNPPKGYTFVCVDSIKVRQELYEMLVMMNIPAMFDFRMGLTSGQFYCVPKHRATLWRKTMNFTDEEADAITPKSACGFELSVAYTIWTMLGVGVSEFVKYLKDVEVPLCTQIDTYNRSIL